MGQKFYDVLMKYDLDEGVLFDIIYLYQHGYSIPDVEDHLLQTEGDDVRVFDYTDALQEYVAMRHPAYGVFA